MPAGDIKALAGVLGIGSQTAAVQALLPGTRQRTRKKAPRKKRARRSAPRKAARKAPNRKKRPARMVKGSAAAKKHMAKLRRMQKKR